METNLVMAIIGVILVLGLTVLYLLSQKKTTFGLNKEEYQVEWMKIMNSFDTRNDATYEISVLNADKLVDKALRELNFGGETMGERMKTAQNKFSDLNGIWTAHKLRNRIAHETDLYLKANEVKYALAQFKKALKDLGAI